MALLTDVRTVVFLAGRRASGLMSAAVEALGDCIEDAHHYAVVLLSAHEVGRASNPDLERLDRRRMRAALVIFWTRVNDLAVVLARIILSVVGDSCWPLHADVHSLSQRQLDTLQAVVNACERLIEENSSPGDVRRPDGQPSGLLP